MHFVILLTIMDISFVVFLFLFVLMMGAAVVVATAVAPAAAPAAVVFVVIGLTICQCCYIRGYSFCCIEFESCNTLLRCTTMKNEITFGDLYSREVIYFISNIKSKWLSSWLEHL